MAKAKIATKRKDSKRNDISVKYRGMLGVGFNGCAQNVASCCVGGDIMRGENGAASSAKWETATAREINGKNQPK